MGFASHHFKQHTKSATDFKIGNSKALGDYMTKGNISRMILSTGFILALSACSDIEGVDYLPLGHPADIDSRSGKTEPMSNALLPELITITPHAKSATTGAATPGTSTGSGAAPMDHSMHGGGR